MAPRHIYLYQHNNKQNREKEEKPLGLPKTHRHKTLFCGRHKCPHLLHKCCFGNIKPKKERCFPPSSCAPTCVFLCTIYQHHQPLTLPLYQQLFLHLTRRAPAKQEKEKER